MHIRMTKTETGSVDGIAVSQYAEGQEYHLTNTDGERELARAFVAAGSATDLSDGSEREPNKAELLAARDALMARESELATEAARINQASTDLALEAAAVKDAAAANTVEAGRLTAERAQLEVDKAAFEASKSASVEVPAKPGKKQ
jgi:hypothetical protein